MSSGESQPTDPGAPSVIRPAPLRPETLCLLIGLALLLLFLALEPYLSYAVFGSDTGEYYHLTAALVATGHIPVGAAYGGWGVSYPDFPGIYLLAAGASGAVGLTPFTALTVIIPGVAVLSVFPLFLLFRRLYPHDTVALLAAAIASIAMPRLFSLAHPAPLALGDFLAVAALWMLVETRRDTRWFVPLSLTSVALIVTHHLSTYFFLVGAIGGLFFLELWRPGLWSRRFPMREFVYLGAFLTATLVFWFAGTTTFIPQVILPGLPRSLSSPAAAFAALEAAGLAVIAVVALLIVWRRRSFRATRSWVRLPTDRSVLRDAVLLLIAIFGGVALLLVVPIPGTTQGTTASAILWFSPFLALVVLASGSRKALTPARLGPFALTWIAAIGLSAIAALAVGSLLGSAVAGYVQAIPPARHAEYLVLPLGLLIAVGIARLVTRAGDVGGRRAFVAGCVAVVVVLAANAAIVYPPQADFGGFEEGLTHGDEGIWLWVGIAEPQGAVVASDHRLSSMIFGFDGNRATWDSTPALFNGNNFSAAYSELEWSQAPHASHAIDLVAVDSVMYGGVALNPAALAQPLSASAIAWFEGLPFIPVYENGLNVVYLVVLSSVPVPPGG
jgi:hypothetical protein